MSFYWIGYQIKAQNKHSSHINYFNLLAFPFKQINVFEVDFKYWAGSTADVPKGRAQKLQ